MSKKLVKKEQNQVDVVRKSSSWAKPYQVKSDMIIPSVSLMHYTSEKVKDQTAKFGEWRVKLNDELLGDSETPFEFIPFYIRKTWVEYDTTNGDGFGEKVFIRIMDIDHTNENLKYNDKLNKISRDKVYSVFALRAVKYNKSIPVVIPFRRTSLDAGLQINNQMYYDNEVEEKSPAGYTILLSSTKKSGQKGDYAVAVSKTGRETTEEEENVAKRWLDAVIAGQAKMSDDDLKSEEVAEEIKPEHVTGEY